MDVLTSYRPFSAAVKPLPAPPVNGRGRPAIERLTKSQRAALGVAVLRGEACLRPTLKVVARALGVSATYIETAWDVDGASGKSVEVLFPSWGKGARVWAVSASGERTALNKSRSLEGIAWFHVESEHSGYVVVIRSGARWARARAWTRTPRHAPPRRPR